MTDDLAQAADYCDALRRQIEHEDMLTVNRLSWLVASQSFLFTGYAIVMNGPVQPRNAAFAERSDLLLKLIPLMAIGVCILIYLGICGALRVMKMLHRDMRKAHDAPLGLRPPIQGTRLTLALGMAAPMLVPPLFAIVWLAVLLA